MMFSNRQRQQYQPLSFLPDTAQTAILVVLVALFPSALPLCAVNLLDNSSFETGTGSWGAVKKNKFNYVLKTTDVDASVTAHTGKNSLRLYQWT